MKKFQRALVRLSVVVLLLGLARLANAACDLKIVSAATGPCLANSTAGNPNVGDFYGLKVTWDVVGTPTHPFRILFTMANQSYSVSNVTVGTGNNYYQYLDFSMDLDDAIPWSVTLDPDGVSGDTNLANNTASGTFTPTPPTTATDLFDPQVWNGFETYTYNFSGGTLSSLYALYGYPTTHGAQTAISDTPPPAADYIVTPPYGMPILQTSQFNVPATMFVGTNNFVIQTSRTRVNPAILRTATWADMSTMSTNWTQWIMPDPRCQSTDPAITNFARASLPADFMTSMTPYDVARTLHKAVMKALVYEEPPPSIDAVSCLQNGIADCGGYAALLVAALRNVGIPARCISGFRQGEDIPHVRTEFHLPVAGTDWIVADATDGFDYDPTGTYAYDFGITSDANMYVAVDAGDIHVLPYNTFEFIQVPNLWAGPSDTSLISFTNTYALTATPSIALLAKPSYGGNVSGAGAYTAGSSVTITAIPTNGWAFSAWADGNTQASRSVTVPGGAGTNYIANFVSLATTLSINVSGNLSFGNVTTGTTATATLTIGNTGNTALTVTNISYPNGYSGAFSGTIPAGSSTNVTVTFAPSSISVFSGVVTVNSSATSGASTIAATGAGIAAATGPTMATITVEANPSDWGTVTGGGTFAVGSSQQISATAFPTWTFGSWNDGNTQNQRTIIVPAGGAMYTATFIPATQSSVAMPSITPNGGDLADSVKVTLKSTTPKAIIYYTTDGSTPTTSSLRYKSAITLTNSATLTAVAYLGANASAPATASFTINTPSITSATTLPDATSGTEYSTTLAATGGTAPYKWKLFGTKLPTGLKLASTGIISGKAKAASNGPVTFIVELTDAKKGIAKQTFTLTVN